MSTSYREKTQEIMDRVGELEEHWLEGVDHFRDMNSLLEEAREILGKLDGNPNSRSWEMNLARPATRLASLDHAIQINMHQLHIPYQVDPLFAPAPENARRVGG